MADRFDVDALLEDLTGRDWSEPDGGEVRFAFVGLGSFNRDSALPAAASATYADVGAVVSGDPGTAARVGEEYDARALTYEEFAAGAAVDAYDAVYVCTPNARHLPHVETAAKQGKPVLCEKPLEADRERAERALAACEAADVRLFTAYRMQCEPATRRMHDLIRRGFVGDPVFAHGAFTFPLDDPGWRGDAELAGGGAMMDVGVYPLNTARFLLDDDPVRASATTRTRSEPYAEGGTDEDVAFELAFAGGTTLHGRASFGAAGDSYIEVKGSEGRVRLDFAFAVAPTRTLTLQRRGFQTTVEGIDRNEVIEEFDRVASAILREESIGLEGEEGVIDVRAAEAIYEAARTGTTVPVPLEGDH
jgi:xylose dehydrogenase (NAD/NADP)